MGVFLIGIEKGNNHTRYDLENYRRSLCTSLLKQANYYPLPG
jgi:hypothetical protein